MFYKVHFPDDKTVIYKTHYTDRRLPGLGKIFYNAIDIVGVSPYNISYYEIVEICENELWVEEIAMERYDGFIRRNSEEYFTHFTFIDDNSYRLREYRDPNAVCIICNQFKLVCCNDGFQDKDCLIDKNPRCTDCCDKKKHPMYRYNDI